MQYLFNTQTGTAAASADLMIQFLLFVSGAKLGVKIVVGALFQRLGHKLNCCFSSPILEISGKLKFKTNLLEKYKKMLIFPKSSK